MNPINSFQNSALFKTRIWLSASDKNGKPAQSLGYAEAGLLIPQPPHRRVPDHKIVISFFFTSGWDVAIRKL